MGDNVNFLSDEPKYRRSLGLIRSTQRPKSNLIPVSVRIVKRNEMHHTRRDDYWYKLGDMSY